MGEGSCDIFSKRKIDVQMIMSDSCYCFLKSEEGDISLGIPDTTNSTVNLWTDNGIITYDNLVFNQLIHNDKMLNGVLGTGEAEIDIYSEMGNIMLYGL